MLLFLRVLVLVLSLLLFLHIDFDVKFRINLGFMMVMVISNCVLCFNFFVLHSCLILRLVRKFGVFWEIKQKKLKF